MTHTIRYKSQESTIMKKAQLAYAVIALAAITTTAIALDLTTSSTTPAPKADKAATTPVGDATAINAMIGVSPTTPEENLIPVIIKDRPDRSSMTAKVTNLQTKGTELGIEAMNIEGSNTTKPTENGTNEVNVFWGTASVVGPNGTKYTTHITKPLSSVVETPQDGDVQAGAQFTAKGDPKELLAAWGRLQELMAVQTSSPTTVEREQAQKTSESAGGQAKQEDEKEVFTPQTTVKKEPVITTTSNGCNINVDLDQMVAIVQERTLEDGKEVAACQDTLTRYPLEKSTTCAP